MISFPIPYLEGLALFHDGQLDILAPGLYDLEQGLEGELDAFLVIPGNLLCVVFLQKLAHRLRTPTNGVRLQGNVGIKK